MKFLLVFLGGGAGSLLRYAIGLVLQPLALNFPWATLLANGLAAVLIGLLYALDLRAKSADLWMLAVVGFCGGLSTFSTFGLETIQLHNQGYTAYALLNVLVSISLGIGLVYLSYRLFS